eukprot:NODE_1861_length_1777_cov_21.412334_g1580_i0.p1 GENE.NODE_1861_length_1777_cov_21.412334_g1580_i0~~NODE_1861_length_1777_cov_21.412334_g1580_i0.p1  ORF type:complete len:299 (+),score=51.22 NODE_1861_length_1777_cov_21.412334_g1580_i0:732-1628(+)
MNGRSGGIFKNIYNEFENDSSFNDEYSKKLKQKQIYEKKSENDGWAILHSKRPEQTLGIPDGSFYPNVPDDIESGVVIFEITKDHTRYREKTRQLEKDLTAFFVGKKIIGEKYKFSDREISNEVLWIAIASPAPEHLSTDPIQFAKNMYDKIIIHVQSSKYNLVRKMIDEHKLFYWLLPFRAVEIFEDAVSIPSTSEHNIYDDDKVEYHQEEITSEIIDLSRRVPIKTEHPITDDFHQEHQHDIPYKKDEMTQKTKLVIKKENPGIDSTLERRIPDEHNQEASERYKGSIRKRKNKHK